MIEEARTALAELLAQIVASGYADHEVYSYIPESLIGPGLVIQPGSPYLTTDEEPYGFYRVAFRVTVVAGVADNLNATAALDAILGVLVAGLHSSDFAIQEVSEPYVYQDVQALHLAADVLVYTSAAVGVGGSCG